MTDVSLLYSMKYASQVKVMKETLTTIQMGQTFETQLTVPWLDLYNWLLINILKNIQYLFFHRMPYQI